VNWLDGCSRPVRRRLWAAGVAGGGRHRHNEWRTPCGGRDTRLCSRTRLVSTTCVC